MEHIAALLLIVGCSGDYAQCRELPAPIPLYETTEECEGDLPIAMAMVSDEAERVLARCVFVDPALEEEDADLVWDIKPDGTLHASIEVPEVAVASVPATGENNRRRE